MRNQILTRSDWTQLPDVQNRSTNTQEWKDAWAKYRQDLRDLPDTYDKNYPAETNPNIIIWPIMPSGVIYAF